MSADAEKMRAVLDAFREAEWSNRSDWQGLCPFRRTHGCHATDGRVAAMGTPTPRPHSEHCPYAKLDALEAE